jgi:hypothetical protein
MLCVVSPQALAQADEDNVENAEQTTMELEALASIYMDDFKIIEETAQAKSLELQVWPTQAGENYVGAVMQVTLPTLYPSVAPVIALRSSKHLTSRQRSDLQAIVDGMVRFY